MPKIFSAPANVQGGIRVKQATADMFGGGSGLETAGKALADFGEQLEKRAEATELSDVTKRLSEERANWTVHLMDKVASGDIEPGGAGFTESVMADFDKNRAVGQTAYKTAAAQRRAEEGYANLRANLMIQAMTQQSAAAAKKRAQDHRDGVAADQVTLIRHPQALDDVLAARVAAIGEMRLSSADKQKLVRDTTNDYAKRAVTGWIDVNPEFALKRLESGEFDDKINAEDLLALRSMAEREIREDEKVARDIEALAEKREKEAQEATKQDFLERAEPDAENPLTRKEVLRSNLDAAGQEHYLKVLDDRAKPKPAATNPAVFNELFRRVHLPKDHPDHIDSDEELQDNFAGGNLSFADFKQLRAERVAATKDPATTTAKKTFLAAMKSNITGTTIFGRDHIGDEQYHKFTLAYLKEAERLMEEGVPEIDLYTPGSKSYLGGLAEAFTRTPAEIAQSIVGGFSGAASPGAVAPPTAAPAPPTEDDGRSVTVPINIAPPVPDGATGRSANPAGVLIYTRVHQGETYFYVGGEWKNRAGEVLE